MSVYRPLPPASRVFCIDICYLYMQIWVCGSSFSKVTEGEKKITFSIKHDSVSGKIKTFLTMVLTLNIFYFISNCDSLGNVTCISCICFDSGSLQVGPVWRQWSVWWRRQCDLYFLHLFWQRIPSSRTHLEAVIRLMKAAMWLVFSAFVLTADPFKSDPFGGSDPFDEGGNVTCIFCICFDSGSLQVGPVWRQWSVWWRQKVRRQ